MSNGVNNSPFLYPNVTSIPGSAGASSNEKLQRPQNGAPTEFDRVFDKELGRATEALPGKDLQQIKAPLKFSSHATQRLRDRQITLDSALMAKVSDAVEKAEAKGLDDTLVLTPQAALIVSAKNRTVITAIDKNSLTGNVFTNIDGAVIV